MQAIAYLTERNPTAAAKLDANIARCIERLRFRHRPDTRQDVAEIGRSVLIFCATVRQAVKDTRDQGARGSGHSSAMAWRSRQSPSTLWTLWWIGFLQKRDPGTTAMRLRRSASTLTSSCRCISFLRPSGLRFRRLSSDSASGPNRSRRSGVAFTWLRTRGSSRVMTDS